MREPGGDRLGSFLDACIRNARSMKLKTWLQKLKVGDGTHRVNKGGKRQGSKVARRRMETQRKYGRGASAIPRHDKGKFKKKGKQT